ncbi:MAG: PepSY domain-containing protein [bacterium]
MQTWRVVLAVSMVSCFVGCASIKSAFKDDEESIPLSSVPTAVTEAAVSAVKGFAATKASMEKHEGRPVYELEGKADGGNYELKITAEGRLLKLKLEED